ncbi:beta-ketoacyl-ACP synthase II, partial [Hyphomonas sp.]|uniref:beta-ketoacyl-ACP synthase II n=1 Tax=Hyphomonas sp. TaxID=87 RepID=UPI0032EB7B6E
MSDRRVVITGIGIVSPLAFGREATWERLIAGKSGAGRIDVFDPEDMPCKIAFQVPWTNGRGGGAGDPHAFDPDKFVSPKELRRIDEFILYAIAAAEEAVEDADWRPEDDESRERTGVMIGSGIGGLESIYNTAVTLHEHGPRKVSPFFIPSALINLASGQVSIKHGFKGPNHAVVTACATGAHAIGDSARLIKYGDADVMLAGGSEAVIGRIAIAGFCAAKAMSTNFNDTPEKASRPYDKDRDGFVMGDGAAVLVLEEYEHAKARGAKIYGEIVGYGATSDGYDMVAPSGEGGVRCMKMALETVNAPIDYINPHATSTPVGDSKEMEGIRELFGDKCPPISATKSLTGHSLGATGVQEAIYSLLMLNNRFVAESAHI